MSRKGYHHFVCLSVFVTHVCSLKVGSRPLSSCFFLILEKKDWRLALHLFSSKRQEEIDKTLPKCVRYNIQEARTSHFEVYYKTCPIVLESGFVTPVHITSSIMQYIAKCQGGGVSNKKYLRLCLH